MPNKEGAGTKPVERSVAFTRLFDAPRDLVFRLWTEPEHLARWWGPRGFTNPVCEVDARPGGALRIVMRAPDGTEYPMTGIFREITPPERLVMTSAALDEDGKPLLEAVTTVTFVEEGGKTRLMLEARGVALTDLGARMIGGMSEGWSQSLDRLGEHLATRP
jgi:uncharacterized protein YndB with AHSA1/START domain